MPRKLKLLLLALALGAPVCATPAAARQDTPTQQTASADEELARAKGMLARGETAAAVASLKPLAERRKTDADAWYYLGFALASAGNPKEGRKAFERALKLRPDSAQARAGLAYALLLLYKPRDAESEAQRALASEPRQAEAHYVLAATRFREDKFSEALAEAESALSANPDFPSATRLAADALLNAYFEEVSRQAKLYPTGPDVGQDEFKLMMEKREPALSPFRLRMRELAERLDAFAAARPNDPQAASWRELAETLRISGRSPGQRAPGDIYPSSEVTTRAIITYKPEPGFTEKARSQNTSGVVRLRVVLGSDGLVRNIVAIKRLPNGLTERAIEAARKIRFTPATLQGRPVSQAVVLEYNFEVFTRWAR